MSCIICGVTDNLQIHHDSHNPPKTRILCKKCHTQYHHHGTGIKTTKNPIELQKIYESIKPINEKRIVIQTKITLNISKLSEKIANAQGITLSEYLRNLIIQDIDRRTIITTAVKEEIAKSGGK